MRITIIVPNDFVHPGPSWKKTGGSLKSLRVISYVSSAVHNSMKKHRYYLRLITFIKDFICPHRKYCNEDMSSDHVGQISITTRPIQRLCKWPIRNFFTFPQKWGSALTFFSHFRCHSRQERLIPTLEDHSIKSEDISPISNVLCGQKSYQVDSQEIHTTRSPNLGLKFVSVVSNGFSSRQECENLAY
jgi:hypothetical protein